MKNYPVFFLAILLLSSCSQQQFSFRKKIAVQHSDKVVVQNHLKKNTDSITNVEANNQITYTKPVPFLKQHQELASESITVSPDDTIRKKYKFEEDRRPSNSSFGSKFKNGDFSYDERADKDALVGFIFSLAGWFLFPFFAILGLIYSVRGLKSFRRKGLAVAGIIISSVVLLLLVLLLILLFVLISRFGA